MYQIFLSHTWRHKNYYQKIKKILETNGSDWKIVSVPPDDPCHNSKILILKGAIEKRIYHCSCIVFLGGLYSDYTKWIKYELSAAKRFKKPIILVEMMEDKRSSDLLTKISDAIADSTPESIISAIKEVAIKIQK